MQPAPWQRSTKYLVTPIPGLARTQVKRRGRKKAAMPTREFASLAPKTSGSKMSSRAQQPK